MKKYLKLLLFCSILYNACQWLDIYNLEKQVKKINLTCEKKNHPA